MEQKIKANLVVWAILMVGCGAMTVVAYYDEQYPENLVYVFFALTIAALAVAGVVMWRKKII